MSPKKKPWLYHLSTVGLAGALALTSACDLIRVESNEDNNSTPQPIEVTGTVQGRVIDASTGAGVAGADVALNLRGTVVHATSLADDPATAVNEAGLFAINNVPVTDATGYNYTLMFAKAGYSQFQTGFSITSFANPSSDGGGNGSNSGQGAGVGGDAGSQTPIVFKNPIADLGNIQLFPANGSISGRVFGVKGPAAGVTVFLLPNSLFANFEAIRTTTTDANGRYEFTGLSLGLGAGDLDGIYYSVIVRPFDEDGDGNDDFAGKAEDDLYLTALRPNITTVNFEMEEHAGQVGLEIIFTSLKHNLLLSGESNITIATNVQIASGTFLLFDLYDWYDDEPRPIAVTATAEAGNLWTLDPAETLVAGRTYRVQVLNPTGANGHPITWPWWTPGSMDTLTLISEFYVRDTSVDVPPAPGPLAVHYDDDSNSITSHEVDSDRILVWDADAFGTDMFIRANDFDHFWFDAGEVSVEFLAVAPAACGLPQSRADGIHYNIWAKLLDKDGNLLVPYQQVDSWVSLDARVNRVDETEVEVGSNFDFPDDSPFGTSPWANGQQVVVAATTVCEDTDLQSPINEANALTLKDGHGIEVESEFWPWAINPCAFTATGSFYLSELGSAAAGQEPAVTPLFGSVVVTATDYAGDGEETDQVTFKLAPRGNTTVRTAAAAATTLELADATGFAVGDSVEIGSNPESSLSRTVLEVDTTTNTLELNAVVTAAVGDTVVNTDNMRFSSQSPGLAADVAAAATSLTLTGTPQLYEGDSLILSEGAAASTAFKTDTVTVTSVVYDAAGPTFTVGVTALAHAYTAAGADVEIPRDTFQLNAWDSSGNPIEPDADTIDDVCLMF